MSVEAPAASRAWSARFAALSIRFRYPIVAAALAFSYACWFPAYELVRLHVKTNFFSLLPAEHESVRRLQAIIDKAGGLGDLMVVIRSPSPKENIRYARRLQAALADLPWIRYAEFARDTEFFASHALLYVSRADLRTIERRLRDRYEYEVSRRDPFFVDLLDERPPPLDMADLEARYRRSEGFQPYFASEDGKTLILAVYPRAVSGEIRDSRRFHRELLDKIAAVDRGEFPPGLTVEVGGTFKDRLEEYDSILGDLSVSVWVMASLFFFLLLFYFRQLAAVPLVFVTFALPLSWTFALTRFVVSELNFVTVFLVVILSGLGVDFAIYPVARFLEERSRGKSLHETLAIINARTARASWTSAFTTAAAFWVLVATRFLGFKQFGIIAGFGITFAYLSAFLVLPSLLAIADGWKLLRLREARVIPLVLGGGAGRFTVAGASVVTLATLLAVAGGALAPRLDFEYDFSKLKTRLTPESRELRETIREILGGWRDPVVVLASDREETAEIESVLAARIAADRASRTIDAVMSLEDVVPDDQPAKLEIIASIRTLLSKMEPFAAAPERETIAKYRRLMEASPITAETLPPNLQRLFFGQPGTRGNFVYLLHRVPLSDTRRAATLVEDVRTIEGGGKVWHGASEAVVVDDLMRIMKEDSRRAISYSIAAVFLVLLYDFRSARRALITLVPLAMGLSWMLALMWLLGLKLNLYNMVVLPSIIGVGVDSGVHVYHRFLETPDRPLAETLRNTTGAVAMCALTTLIGFGSMIFSVHNGLASLGALAVLALSCTLIAASAVFPLLLERFRRFCL